MLRDADGKTLHPALALSAAEVSANQAVFHCTDAQLGLNYRATFQLHSNQVIVCWSEIESQQPVILHHLAAPDVSGLSV